jgi:hypothetical protein
MQMKRLVLSVVILFIVEIVPCAVYAQVRVDTPSVPKFLDRVTVGKPVAIFADPSDVVVQADTAGLCGSAFFHIQRTHANFKELTAAALTAIATGKFMTFFVERCSGDHRNILSHGAVRN